MACKRVTRSLELDNPAEEVTRMERPVRKLCEEESSSRVLRRLENRVCTVPRVTKMSLHLDL